MYTCKLVYMCTFGEETFMSTCIRVYKYAMVDS